MPGDDDEGSPAAAPREAPPSPSFLRLVRLANRSHTVVVPGDYLFGIRFSVAAPRARMFLHVSSGVRALLESDGEFVSSVVDPHELEFYGYVRVLPGVSTERLLLILGVGAAESVSLLPLRSADGSVREASAGGSGGPGLLSTLVTFQRACRETGRTDGRVSVRVYIHRLGLGHAPCACSYTYAHICDLVARAQRKKRKLRMKKKPDEITIVPDDINEEDDNDDFDPGVSTAARDLAFVAHALF